MDVAYLEGLYNTLTLITSPNTEAIRNASEELQKRYYSQKLAMPALVHILIDSRYEQAVRQLAGVEARKLVPVFWVNESQQSNDENSSRRFPLSPQERAEIQAILLQALKTEKNTVIQGTLCKLVAAVAGAAFESTDEAVPSNFWPELMPFLFAAAKLFEACERETSLYLLSALLDSPDVGPSIAESAIDLLHFFSSTIKDPQSLKVRVYTCTGLALLAESIDASSIPRGTPTESNAVELFRAALPDMLRVLNDVVSQNDEKLAHQVFNAFSSFLTSDGALISKHLSELVSFYLQNIALRRGEINEDYRAKAVSFIISLSRSKKSKIKALKLGKVLLEASLQIAQEYENDLDANPDDLNDETPGQLSLRLIDSLSSTLPPSQVIEPLLQALPVLSSPSSSPDPAKRRAIFLALSAAVEGSPDYVANHFVDGVLPYVRAGLDDPDFTVRVTALQALSQLASDLNEIVGEEHETLLPQLFVIMSSATNLKVCKCALTALDAFLEVVDRDVISKKYLQYVIPQLLLMLNATDEVEIQISIVAAISSASSSAGTHIESYFSAIIERLVPYLRIDLSPYRGPKRKDEEDSSFHKPGEQDIKLFAITLDALGVLASALGATKFAPYLEHTLETAYQALTSHKESLRESGLIAIGSLARVYQEGFAPYLEKIMPEVLKYLEQDEWAGLDDEDDDDPTSDSRMIKSEEQAEADLMEGLEINSGITIEKEIACDTLGEIISSTKTAFMPFMDRTTELLLEHCHHYYEGLKNSALIAYWRIYRTFYTLYTVESGIPANTWIPGLPDSNKVPETVATVASTCCSVSLQLLKEEDERTVVMTILDNFTEAIKMSGPTILRDSKIADELAEAVMQILQRRHLCQIEELEDDFAEGNELEGNDFEERDGSAESSELDEALVDSAMDVVVQLASVLQEQFLGKPMESFLTIVIQNFTKSRSATERASGIGMIAEVVNHLKQLSTRYERQLFEVLVQGLDDKNIEVRSNASYGVGLLCYFCQDKEDFIKSKYPGILQKLQRLLAKAEKQRRSLKESDENANNERGLANACGCVARMALAHEQQVPLDDVVAVMLSRLPIQDGYEENPPIFEFLITQHRKGLSKLHNEQGRLLEILDALFAQQAVTERQVSSSAAPLSDIVYPIESSNMMRMIVDFLKELESKFPGSVSSRPNLVAAIQ